jgi:hypothetical protein
MAFLPHAGVTTKNPPTGGKKQQKKHADSREMKRNSNASRRIKSVPQFLILSSCVDVCHFKRKFRYGKSNIILHF